MKVMYNDKLSPVIMNIASLQEKFLSSLFWIYKIMILCLFEWISGTENVFHDLEMTFR